MMPLLPVSDIFAFPVLLKVLHRQTFNGVSGILQTGNIGISETWKKNVVAKSQEMDIWKFSKWSHCTNIYLKCMPFVHDMQLNIPIMYSLFMRRQNSQQCKFPHLVSRRDSYICRCIGLTYVDFIVCQRIFLTFVDGLFFTFVDGF